MITIVTNPQDARYSSADNATIDCLLGVRLTPGSKAITDIPFTASPTDTEAHGRQLYADLVAGKFGTVAPYVEPVLTQEEAILAAERMKARLLNEADRVIAPLERAVKLNMATDEEKARLDAWERYSVLLNRIDVDKPEWPDKPGD